jgi:hypothetical protein
MAKQVLFALTTDAIITKDLKGVTLVLEAADPQTGGGTGESYRIGMPTGEAMKLLGLLQEMQRLFGLQTETGEPFMN